MNISRINKGVSTHLLTHHFLSKQWHHTDQNYWVVWCPKKVHRGLNSSTIYSKENWQQFGTISAPVKMSVNFVFFVLDRWGCQWFSCRWILLQIHLFIIPSLIWKWIIGLPSCEIALTAHYTAVNKSLWFIITKLHHPRTWKMHHDVVSFSLEFTWPTIREVSCFLL